LIAQNVVVVTGSGNSGGAVDGYPALFASPNAVPYIPDLIVAGGINPVTRWLYSNGQRGDFIDIYAPAQQVVCARADNVDYYGPSAGLKVSQGTSLGMFEQ
jgi:hypothetical protein